MAKKKTIAEKNRDDTYKKAFQLIKKHHPITIDELSCLCGISRNTFYKYFPKDSDKYDAITREMSLKKYEMKSMMRVKWSMSDNAKMNEMAYKLMSDKQERALLADRHDVSLDGEVGVKQMGNITKEVVGSDGKVLKKETLTFNVGEEVKGDDDE